MWESEVVPLSENKFEVYFASKLSDAKKIVDSSLRFIQDGTKNASTDALRELKLVLCELLYNAVIHGNEENETKKVFISIKILDNNTILTVIADEGNGFDHKNLIFNLANNEEIDVFDEHGRGIRLAIALVDKIHFNSNGNRIEFIKKVEWNG